MGDLWVSSSLWSDFRSPLGLEWDNVVLDTKQSSQMHTAVSLKEERANARWTGRFLTFGFDESNNPMLVNRNNYSN
jgi:hypothetical protein